MGIAREHLLRGTLREEVSVPQVVDLNVLDVIAIGHVHLPVDCVRRC
jgi:hypothetical protein